MTQRSSLLHLMTRNLPNQSAEITSIRPISKSYESHKNPACRELFRYQYNSALSRFRIYRRARLTLLLTYTAAVKTFHLHPQFIIEYLNTTAIKNYSSRESSVGILVKLSYANRSIVQLIGRLKS